MWRCDVLEDFLVILPEKMVEVMMRNVPVGGWGGGVCVCVLCWLKKKKKGEEEWEWPAKERKEGVDCVMGSGVRWGARGNQQSDFFFFLTDETLHKQYPNRI